MGSLRGQKSVWATPHTARAPMDEGVACWLTHRHLLIVCVCVWWRQSLLIDTQAPADSDGKC